MKNGDRKTTQKLKMFYLVLVTITLLVLVMEITSRLIWSATLDIGILDSSKIIYKFYPELREIDNAPQNSQDNEFRVLVLGGSVVGPYYGFDSMLEYKLSRALGKRVKIYNAARAAHTSRDSAIKYRYLKNKRFDLIILYHAVNDVRANNVPPRLFRNDYSHYYWYKMVNLFGGPDTGRRLVSTKTAQYAALILGQRMGMLDKKNNPNDPPQTPKKEWLQYGGDIKTAISFRDNITTILSLAQMKQERVLLMTATSYIPPGYSYNKFMKKALDYSGHYYPLEIWGEPKNVEAGIAVHNAIVRDIALNARGEVIFIDMEKEFPASGLYFLDAVHLSRAGMDKFTTMIADHLTEYVK